jgi:hypothetical protein
MKNTWPKRRQPKRAWAIVSNAGKIILGENLRPMLIFDRKWRANAAIWKDGEKVVEVFIHFK